jgi:hypothetical protein
MTNVAVRVLFLSFGHWDIDWTLGNLASDISSPPAMVKIMKRTRDESLSLLLLASGGIWLNFNGLRKFDKYLLQNSDCFSIFRAPFP